MYSPKLLRDQRHVLSGATAANAYKSEIAFVRTENRLEQSEIGPAVMRAISWFEAASTIRVDGFDPDLRELAFADSMDLTPSSELFDRSLIASSFCTRRAVLESLYYLRTLRWIVATVRPGYVFRPGFILNVHSRCMYGKDAGMTGVRFRAVEYDNPNTKLFHLSPPSPEQLYRYVEDICWFMNAAQFSPLTQSGFMHFQFESIKPFKTALDRTGRALCHALFYFGGLLDKTILPIALLPAINTRLHAGLLLPYDINRNGSIDDETSSALAIDSWTNFCAVSSEVAISLTDRVQQAFGELVDDWTSSVGKVSSGSTAEKLIRLLPGWPFITVERACRLTDRGFSAVNEAVDKLVRAGVLMNTNLSSRNGRIFEARGVSDVIKGIDSQLIKERPIARSTIVKEPPHGGRGSASATRRTARQRPDRSQAPSTKPETRAATAR